MAQQPLESDQVVVEEGKGQPATATSSNSSDLKGDDSSTKSTVARKYYQVKHIKTHEKGSLCNIC